MSQPDAPERDDAKVAAAAAAVLGFAFCVAAGVIAGGKAALSVAIGAGIAVANLLTMRAIIRSLVRAPEEPSPAEGEEGADGEAAPATRPDHEGTGRRGGVAWGIFAVLKILVLFGGVWVLLTRGWVDPIALVVGYGVLPLGIAASSLIASLAPRGTRQGPGR